LLDRGAAAEPFAKGLYLRYGLEHIPYEAYWEQFRKLDRRGYGSKHTLFNVLISTYALPASIEDLTADFRLNAWRGCRAFLFPETKNVLHKLRQRGCMLGIVTNGPKGSQRIKLTASGVAPLVDVALISGEEEIAKPSPEIFTRAADRLGLSPSECVFVGDNPRTDICGAHDAGMTTVWLDEHQSWPEDFTFTPDYTITRLEEVLEIELRDGG